MRNDPRKPASAPRSPAARLLRQGLAGLLCVPLALALGCKAQDQPATAQADANAPATAYEVAHKPDGSWIKVTGKVVTTAPDSFALDYGPGIITIEMDDWDWFPEGKLLLPDDDVIVYGYVDQDFYEARKIEASSVYVKDLGTQFYASGVDEEDFPVLAATDFRPRVEMYGEVKDVDVFEFQLDTGHGVIDVDVTEMPYNPLDDEGYQILKEGDRVLVSGVLDDNLFTAKDLEASTIISLESKSPS